MNIPDKPRNNYRQLWALFVLIFIDSLNYFLVIPVFQRLFSSHFNLLPANTSTSMRDLLFGIATLLSPLAFVIFSPIIGYYSDKLGRKKILIFCLALSFIGYLLPIVGIRHQQLWLILLGRFIAGTSTGSQPVAQATVADLTQGKQKAIYLAIIGFAMTIAMTIGPAAGSYLSDTQLVSWFSVATPYWVGMCLSLLNILLLLFFLRESKPTANTHNPPLISAVRKPMILLLFLVFFLLECAWSQYYQALFLFLPKNWAYSINKTSLFMGYIGIWMSLGLTLVYRIGLRHMTIERFLKLSLILVCIGMFFCSVTQAAYWQWIFVVLSAIFTGTAYASLLALLSNHTSRAHQGVILGFTSTILGVSWAITGFSSSVLINIQLHLPLYVSFAAVALALLFLFCLAKKARGHDSTN